METNPLANARPGTVEYRRAAHELAILDAAFGAAAFGLVVLDELGRIQRANRAFGDLIGHDPRALEGHHLSILAPDSIRLQAREELTQFLHGPEGVAFDCRVPIGDGLATLTFLRRGLAVEGRNYDLVSVIDSSAELEIRAALEARVAEAQRAQIAADAHANHAVATADAQAQRVSGLARELRGALDALIAARRGTEDGVGDSAIDHLGGLVDELTNPAAARPRARWNPEVESFDVNPLITACVAMVKPDADRGQVELVYRAPEAPAVIAGDRRAVRQMVLALLSNAVKYTPPGGKMALGITIEPGTAAITVADTGAGIAADRLARVTRAAQPIEDPLDTRHRGTGISLALARLIAERLGGTLVLQSALGKGTRVTVRLPLGEAAPIAE